MFTLPSISSTESSARRCYITNKYRTSVVIDHSTIPNCARWFNVSIWVDRGGRRYISHFQVFVLFQIKRDPLVPILTPMVLFLRDIVNTSYGWKLFKILDYFSSCSSRYVKNKRPEQKFSSDGIAYFSSWICKRKPSEYRYSTKTVALLGFFVTK